MLIAISNQETIIKPQGHVVHLCDLVRREQFLKLLRESCTEQILVDGCHVFIQNIVLVSSRWALEIVATALIESKCCVTHGG